MKNYLKVILGAAVAGAFTGAAVFAAKKLARIDREADPLAEQEAAPAEESAPEIDRSYTTIPTAHTEEAAASDSQEEA